MIHAWKPYNTDDKTGLVSCDKDDPKATRWDVYAPGSSHHMAIECDSLYRAQRLKSAFEAAFKAGRSSR